MHDGHHTQSRVPRIGARRELKFALESYWKNESSLDALKTSGAALRALN